VDLRAREQKRQRRFLHEYYADVFAVYTMGPAYAYTCLLLRFDPKTAYKDGGEHPSYQKRAHVILRTLEEMNNVKGSSGHYSGIIKKLDSWWKESVEAAKPEGSPPPDETLMLLEGFVDELHVKFDRKIHHVRYSGWPQAIKLSNRLTGQYPALSPGDKLRDVLNATWKCRIDASDGNKRGDARALADRAKALCEEIVDRGRENPKSAV
jgi:hypothetical protein